MGTHAEAERQQSQQQQQQQCAAVQIEACSPDGSHGIKGTYEMHSPEACRCATRQPASRVLAPMPLHDVHARFVP